MTVNQRLNFLIQEYFSGKSSHLAKAIGVAPSVISSLMPGNRGNYPSFEVLNKILDIEIQVDNAKRKISTEWLVRGVGEPFKSNDHQIRTDTPLITHGNLQILPITVNDEGDENIVMVNTKAAAGYPTRFLEREFYTKLPTIKIPHVKLRNATFRGFEVEGESMAPTFQPGAIVIARFVEDWDKPGVIGDGRVYVVVTNEKVVIKRVLNRPEKKDLYLMSDNEAWEGYGVETDNIIQLWYVEAAVSFKFPNVRYDWRRKMSQMEGDIYDLKSTLNSILKQLPPKKE